MSDVRIVSETCARPPVKHSPEACDKLAWNREYFYEARCECECHDG